MNAKMPLVAIAFVTLGWSSDARAQYFGAAIAPGLDGNTSDVDYAFGRRGLTLPRGSVELNASADWTRIDVGAASTSSTNLRIGLAYGVSSTVELGVATLLAIDPESEWSDVIAARAVIQLIDESDLDVAFSVLLPLNTGDGDGLPGVQLGAPLRYRLAQNVYFLALHNLLYLGLEQDVLDVAGNVALALQVNDSFALRFDTQVVNLRFRDGETTLIGDDFIPLSVNGLFGVGRNVDLYATLLFPDIGDGLDLLTFNFGILARL